MAFTALQGFLFSLFYFIFQNNIALLTKSSELAGNLLSAQSAIGIISGLLGGRILTCWGDRALAYVFIIAGAGTSLVFFSRSIIVLYLSSLALGFIFSLRMPAGYMKSTDCVSETSATLAITVFCCACQIGQFFSPLFANAVSDALGFSREQQFILGGIALLTTGGLSLRSKRS